MTLRSITAPASEPVTLAEAKLHLRVSIATDDALITSLITAARVEAEQQTERSFMPQTWELTLDCFPCVITLNRPPVTSITSLKYLDTAGVQQTLSPSLYALDSDSEPARVVPAYGQSWPSTQAFINAVRVRYVAGYADAAAVPEAIKDWMKIRVNTLYEFREQILAGLPVAQVPFVGGLLDPYRIWSI
jgi:uncharacterized phiE125 gp8 family phage protein